MVAAVALAALLAGGAPRWWRTGLLVLTYPAAIGYFQWRDRTCVALAARSERKLGARSERIEDAEELGKVRAQARRVQRKALFAGAALMLLAVMV